MANEQTTRNPVADRLSAIIDFYIERGDGDDRTVMLIDLLGEVDRLHEENERLQVELAEALWAANHG